MIDFFQSVSLAGVEEFVRPRDGSGWAPISTISTGLFRCYNSLRWGGAEEIGPFKVRAEKNRFGTGG